MNACTSPIRLALVTQPSEGGVCFEISKLSFTPPAPTPRVVWAVKGRIEISDNLHPKEIKS